MTKHDTTLLVATVKNEGPNILEWVAHHRLCGFDRIQIYQNDSTDSTVHTLKTLDRLGIIEYHENRHNKGAHQMRAYRRAARSEAYAKSDWCMVLDGDEFLNVKVGGRKVQDLIEASPDDADAVLVNWRVFGSSAKRDLSGELVTERFSRAEPTKEILHTMSPFKALARTSVFTRPGIHLPRDAKKANPVLVNASGFREGQFERKNWRGLDPGCRKLAQVHHYMVRDLSSFLLKNARGSANAPHRDVGLTYWQKHDRNEEEDLSLASRAFEIWAEMKRLDELAEGQLLRLRQRAIRQWRISLDELLEEDDIRKLRDDILAETPKPTMASPFRLPGTRQPVFSSVRAQKEDHEDALPKTATG